MIPEPERMMPQEFIHHLKEKCSECRVTNVKHDRDIGWNRALSQLEVYIDQYLEYAKSKVSN